MNIYDDFKDYINDITVEDVKPSRVKVQYEQPNNPKQALDDLCDQIYLLDDGLEQYINKLKAASAIITFQDVGPGTFNEQRYADDCKLIETKHRQLQLQVSDPNKTTAEKRAILNEIEPLKRPDKNDPKYLDPTTITNVINVKEAYKRLKQVADRWNDFLNVKKHEINVGNRQSLKVVHKCLLENDNCMKAIAGLFQYPNLIGENGIIDGTMYKDTYSGSLKQDTTIYKFKTAHDRNPSIFDACKTITEYNTAVDDGKFDLKFDDVYISDEDKLKLAKQFVASNGLLDERSVGVIKEFAKRKEDERCASEIEMLVKSHTLD